MKNRILTMLGRADGIVSGEEIGAELGVSRVSVWKHIRALRDLGYRIEAGRRGYRLMSREDVLFPLEFGSRENTIHYHAETGSTMDAARELARQGCPHMTVVVAERQTGGRGRLARPWESLAGGLYFTVVTRPDLPLMMSFRVGFAAAVVLTGLLRDMYGVDARIKWPNDILVEDRKICGMLAEMETEAERIAFINLGIGVNMNNDVSAVTPPAVSLKEISGRAVARKELLKAFLDGFEDRLQCIAGEDILSAWKRHAGALNRRVVVKTTRGDFSGRAVDVDTNGALVLEEDDGSRRRVYYGDCFYQSASPPGNQE